MVHWWVEMHPTHLRTTALWERGLEGVAFPEAPVTDSWTQNPGDPASMQVLLPTCGRSFPLSRANNPRRMGEPKAHLYCGRTATSRWLAQAARPAGRNGTVLLTPGGGDAGRCISMSGEIALPLYCD